MSSTRLRVNINDAAAAALREIAEREGTSVTEVVRRAVSVYKYFYEADREGRQDPHRQ